MNAHRARRVLVFTAAIYCGTVACASSTPAADRIVYTSETLVVRDAGIGASPLAAPAPRDSARRDDIPESVRREWFKKNGPNRGYTPARTLPVEGVAVREVVRERRVYADRGYDRCDDRGWLRAIAPIALSVGYYHGDNDRHHSGFRYGLGWSFPFWYW